MTKTAVAELKAHLSRYLAQVKSGEEVLILERYKPVAMLCPLSKDVTGAAGHLQEMLRQGEVRLGKKPLSAAFWSAGRWKDRRGRARAALLEERRGGR